MPVTPLRAALLATIAILIAGCASVRPSCPAGEQAAVNESLYFGTAIPGAKAPNDVVTVAQWADFLKTVVTPRFPDGFTVWQATGQWRGADGIIVGESSHVLSLVRPDNAATEKLLGEVAAAYKSRFNQEA